MHGLTLYSHVTMTLARVRAVTLARVRAVCGEDKREDYRQKQEPARVTGMRAPQPGLPLYAPNRRGVIRAVDQSCSGKLVAFSSSGSDDNPLQL